MNLGRETTAYIQQRQESDLYNRMKAMDKKKVDSTVRSNSVTTAGCLSVVVRLLVAISPLMVERYTVLVVLRPGHARATTQLVHLRLRAGATVEIGVATNRGEIGITTGMVCVNVLTIMALTACTGGEVVLGHGRRAAHAVIMLRAVASAHTIVAVARVEGRRIGCLAGDTGNASARVV